MKAIAQLVEEAVGPVLGAQGYELVLVEYVAGARVLRVYVDRVGVGIGSLALAAPAGAGSQLAAPAGAGSQSGSAITHGDCTQVSRLIGDVLDAEGLGDHAELGGGRYTLEVSSPGLDRPLVRPAHFAAVVGQTVKLTVHPGAAVAGRRNYVGRLAAADAQAICVAADGEQHTFAYAAIDRARLVPDL